MRPDNLAVYVFLAEAQRLSKIKPWRRFKPAVLKTAHVLVTRLPPKKAVPQKLRQLVDIYRGQINAQDVHDIAAGLGLSAIAAELVEIMGPWLHDIFNSCLEWHDDASVTANFGQTEAQSLPAEIPFDEIGRLEGTLSYGDEKFVFHQGFLMPEKITIELIDAVEDELGYHAALVDLYGVEKYLQESKSTIREAVDGVELLRTDRYAVLRVDGLSQQCPIRLDLQGAKAWRRAQQPLTEADIPDLSPPLPEGVTADPAHETVPDA